MSLPLRLLIAFLVWLLYFLLTYNGCHNELCHACGDKEGAVTEETVPPDDGTATAGTVAAAAAYPIYFKWQDPQAYTNSNLDSLQKVVLSGLEDGQLLEITGHYFEGEPKPEDYDNMGFARADQVKGLFAGQIPNDQLRLHARLMDEPEGARENPFDGVDFRWVAVEEEVATNVEELDDRIIIRFPFGKAQKDYAPEVETYLEKLATRVQQTGESIQLTGHTDNVDTDEFNRKLGQRRADEIKSVLTGHGVDAAQITTISKGESQPVATNDTDEGRHQNRRVEVKLIKKQ